MSADGSRASHPWVRIVAFLALLVVAGFLMPVSAYVVEALAAQAENWIIVVQMVLVTVIGAALGALVPTLGPTASSRAVRTGTWALAGLLAAVLANGVWWLLLTG